MTIYFSRQHCDVGIFTWRISICSLAASIIYSESSHCEKDISSKFHVVTSKQTDPEKQILLLGWVLGCLVKMDTFRANIPWTVAPLSEWDSKLHNRTAIRQKWARSVLTHLFPTTNAALFHFAVLKHSSLFMSLLVHLSISAGALYFLIKPLASLQRKK